MTAARRAPTEAWLIAGAAVLILGLATARWQAMPVSARSPSTHFSGKQGLRALYLVARELGLPARHWGRSLDHPPADGALVVVAPATPLRPAEVDRVMTWLGNGGRLLYVVPPFDRGPLLRALGLEVHWGRNRETSSDEMCALGAQPAAEATSSRARALLEGTPAAVDGFDQLIAEGTSSAMGPIAAASAPHVEPLLGEDGRGKAAVLVEVGAGRAVVLASSRPLENGALGASGVAPLVVRALAELAQGGPIWFDEYHHGFDEQVDLWRASWRYLTQTRPGWMLLQLVATALLALAVAGVRLGGALEAAVAPRRSSLEHVGALAAGYGAARAARRAATLLIDDLRLRLGAASPSDLHRRLEALRNVRPALTGAVQIIATPAPDGGAPDLRRLADAIDHVLAEERHVAKP